MTPLVSVVIPTCGRPALLERCLAAIVRQEFPAEAFEVIVVDDGPSAQTRDAVTRWVARTVGTGAAGPTIGYCSTQRAKGPAAARNLGWRSAQGRIIAFTDDDTVPAADWLWCGVQAIGSARAAVWGRVVVPLPPDPTDYERDAAGLANGGFVTANCFVRVEALQAVGGFDERFRVAWREDSDLEFALRRQFPDLRYAPEAVVVHPIRPAPWGVSLRQQRKVLFDALLYKKHPEHYRAAIRRTPPWHYYATVVALVIALAGLAIDVPVVAWGAGAAWLALTLAFAVRRRARTRRSPAHVAEMLVTSAAIPLLAVYWRLRGAVRFRVPFL
jgi:glycosyltransferase involved in cell wall biosynthesis